MAYEFERDEFRYGDRYLREENRRSLERERAMDDARRELDRLERRGEPVERIAAVVNDPDITLTPDLVKVINDPALVMDRNGSVMKRLGPSGRDVIRSSGQFRSTGIPLPTKRTRKKTKTDRTMSSCLKQANARGKLKNGKFRKGWDQSRIMTYAHKLCRKEMKGTGTKKGQVRKTARRAYERK